VSFFIESIVAEEDSPSGVPDVTVSVAVSPVFSFLDGDGPVEAFFFYRNQFHTSLILADEKLKGYNLVTLFFYILGISYWLVIDPCIPQHVSHC